MSITLRSWYGIPFGVLLLGLCYLLLVFAPPTLFYTVPLFLSLVGGGILFWVGVLSDTQYTLEVKLPTKQRRLFKQLAKAKDVRDELARAMHKLPEDSSLRSMLEQRKIQLDGTVEEIKTEIGYAEISRLDKRAGKLVRR